MNKPKRPPGTPTLPHPIRWLLLLLGAVMSSGCVSTQSFRMTGGPDKTSVVLSGAEFATTLEPYIADSPKAHALLQEAQTQTSLSLGFGVAGLLSVGTAEVLAAVKGARSDGSSSRWRPFTSSVEGDVVLLSSFLGSGLGLGLVQLIIQPDREDWADVVRAYNEERPEAAWSVLGLGIAPEPNAVASTF